MRLKKKILVDSAEVAEETEEADQDLIGQASNYLNQKATAIRAAINDPIPVVRSQVNSALQGTVDRTVWMAGLGKQGFMATKSALYPERTAWEKAVDRLLGRKAPTTWQQTKGHINTVSSTVQKPFQFVAKLFETVEEEATTTATEAETVAPAATEVPPGGWPAGA